jgi:hypothetical protein
LEKRFRENELNWRRLLPTPTRDTPCYLILL